MPRIGTYSPTEWEDKVIDAVTGAVMYEGTPVDETNMNNIEEGLQVSHYDAGVLLGFLVQQQIQNTKELQKIKKQRFLQGQSTITNSSTGGYVRNTDPFVQVALNGFAQINAPNYDVSVHPISGDAGAAGNLEVYDKTQNGFKVRMSGSAKTLTFIWTLLNPNV